MENVKSNLVLLLAFFSFGMLVMLCIWLVVFMAGSNEAVRPESLATISSPASPADDTGKEKLAEIAVKPVADVTEEDHYFITQLSGTAEGAKMIEEKKDSPAIAREMEIKMKMDEKIREVTEAMKARELTEDENAFLSNPRKYIISKLESSK